MIIVRRRAGRGRGRGERRRRPGERPHQGEGEGGRQGQGQGQGQGRGGAEGEGQGESEGQGQGLRHVSAGALPQDKPGRLESIDSSSTRVSNSSILPFPPARRAWAGGGGCAGAPSAGVSLT